MIVQETKNVPTDVCREIPFQITSTHSNTLRSVPIVRGLCVPRGTLTNAGEWLVEGLNGSHYAAQTNVLNRWSDGSIRWLLVSFVAGRICPGTTQCTLVRPDRRPVHPGRTASVTWQENGVSVAFRSGVSTEAADTTTIRIAPQLTASDGSLVNVSVAAVESDLEEAVRRVYTVRLKVAGAPHLKLQQQIEVWPSAGLVRVDTRLRNTRRARHQGGLWDLGDPGSHVFGSLHVDAGFVDQSVTTLKWKVEAEESLRKSSADDAFQLTQYGSGSAAWASTNHVDAQGNVTVRSRGYVAEFGSGTLRGYRAQPTVVLESEHANLAVAVPEFWQQFPGSLEASHRGVSIGLFPNDVGPYELQGGEQKTQSCWLSVQPSPDAGDDFGWVSAPPRVAPTSRWVRQCQVFDWLPAEVPDSDDDAGRLARYLSEATSGNSSLASRRDRIDEYGWRNFGDIHADHEQTHYAGTNTVVSHYNNQFDLVFGGILHSLLSGDAKWNDLFEPMARHVMDIDVYHTTQDRACFNGGLFWHTDHYVDTRTATHRTYSRHNAGTHQSYGGGPSNEHNYTTGLLHYYFLTGNREARDTVQTLADWVINLDDGSRTVMGLVDPGDTGLASQTVFDDFHGPGRGPGNSINALLDAWILTQDQKYMDKADQLIRRVVHPNQDLDALHLADAEGHWSYTVCLTALGRYLSLKLEAGDLDESYAYVRASLDHYGRWMATHEKPTLSQPEKLEYPTEAWAAQDFRKANVLRIAASCTDDTAEELRMRQRADEISDAAWNDLYAFGDQHLTARCLSILMTEGLRDVFHRTCRAEYMPAAPGEYEWGDWHMFVPQKHRVRALVRNPARAVMAAVGALNPVRIFKTVDALRRML